MKQTFSFLSFFLVFLSLDAQDIVWEGKNEVLNIGKKVEILEDPEGTFTIEEMQSGIYDDRFVQSDMVIVNFGYTESLHWLKFSLRNKSGEDLLLEIAHAALPVTDLYYQDSSGQVRRLEAGYRIPVQEKTIKHHFQVFPLPEGETDIYVRLMSHSHPLPVKIWERSAFEIKAYRQRLIYGFYLGFMFFVILNNVFLYFSLRNGLYLFYAFVVFIYICYAAVVMDGFILYFVSNIDLMFWYITIPTLGVSVQTIYCLLFLESKKYIPLITKITWGLIAYFTLYIFVKYLLPITVILTMNTVHALISFFVMGFIGIKVGNKGNKLGYYFALAYFIYFMLVVIEATYIQTGKPPYFLELSHVGFATLIEAFILSFLLSKRFEWEKAEIEKAKLEAQQKVIETTKENERIMKEQNIVLEQKVAERTQQLQQAKAEAEAANEAKSNFLSTVSHELRTPLTSIIGFAKINAKRFVDRILPILSAKDDKAIHAAEQIEHNNAIIISEGRRLTSLINDLLDLAKIESGRVDWKKEKVAPHQLIQQATSATSSLIEQKPKVRLVVDLPEQLPAIEGDKDRLIQVLINLISNAVKFTESGTIRISCRLKKAQAGQHPVSPEGKKGAEDTQAASAKLIFKVEDTGSGIPEDQQQQIFEKFKQVDDNQTGKPKGTGLGLPICKEIIEHHKGKIWVESVFGKGSTFIFSLPVPK